MLSSLRYFLLRHNYVIYLFDVLTFVDHIRITLYFVMFELRMEITLQLRFLFARHCDVFFITSQLRYLFVRCSYVFLVTLELRYILVRSNYWNYVQNGNFLATFFCNQKITKKYVIILWFVSWDTNDSARKELVDFKKRQRKKE